MTHQRQQESSTAMFLYQAVPGSRRGGTFEKTKNHYIGRKCSTGKFWRCRSNEVLKL